MAAVWRLSLSYLKKSKVQNLFIALLILLSTLLVSTAAIIIANTGNLFTEMHSRTNGSHQILTLEKGHHDPQFVHDWWAAQDGVEVTKLLQYRALSGISHQGQDFPNLYLFMMNTPASPLSVDELVFSQGMVSSTPEKGAIWVPTSMANSYNISVGDTISFKAGATTLELRVSAIVVDVPFGAPFSNTSRIWMNSDDYQGKLTALPGNDNYMIGLRFADYSNNSDYWKRFEKDLGTPFLESKMEFESILSFYLIINRIIGFVMIFLGLVMMLIALITIGFTISDSILANYKTIGVLKSLGLTSRRTIATYVMLYSFLSFVSIPPGLVLSTLSSRLILTFSLSSLKTADTDLRIQGFGAAMLIGLILFTLVILFVVLYAKKARKIQPVQAIRYGMSETDNSKISRRMNSAGVRRLGFGHFPATVVIGLRNLIKNIKVSVLMLILTTMASSVLVLGYVLISSITGIQHTAAKWGYDNANIAAVIVNKTEFPRAEFEQVINADSRIANYGWQANITGIISSEARPDTVGQSLSISISVLDGDYRQLGFETLSGNNPRLPNEIALGVNVAKMLNKNLGDVIDVYIEGKQQTFIITGIYQAIANMSISGRITMDAVRAVNPTYNDVDVVFINVNGLNQADTVADALNISFKASTSVVTQQTLLDSVFKEASNILIFPMSLMGLLFVLVTFIIIFSTCRINIRRESKTYGIYKSVGMASKRLRWSITLGIAALSAIGAILGIAAGVYLLPTLLETVLAGYGIVHLPIVLNWGGILLIASINIISAALGAWVSSNVIRKASPRILVVE